MRKLSRRKFLGTGAMGLVAASQLKAFAGAPFTRKVDAPISFQTWGMKDRLSEDFVGTLKDIRAIGYEGLEMCSPMSYGQFEPLKKYSGSELRELIESADMFCKTCHFQAREVLGDDLPITIEYAKQLGLNDVTMSSAGVSREATLDDWKRFAEQANTAAVAVKDAGLRLCYHNHTIGPEFDGVPVYDTLMQLLDGDLIGMQFQIASISGGYDVIAYLAKYPGRYVSLHMHDWDPEARRIVPIGDGVIDWPRLIATAKASGIEDYGLIVEIETPDDPFGGLVRSYEHLRSLQL